MWKYSENCSNIKPLEVEENVDTVYIRKDYVFHEATDDIPEHWSYQEEQISKGYYPIYEMIEKQNQLLEKLASK